MPVDSENVPLGPDARFDLAGNPFRVISGSYRDAGEGPQNVSDSETGRFIQNRVGMRNLEVTLECQYDTEQNFYDGAPFSLRPDDRHAFTLYPFGRSRPDLVWDVPRLRIISADGSAVVHGSRPQNLRFTAVSDGPYTRPGAPAAAPPEA